MKNESRTDRHLALLPPEQRLERLAALGQVTSGVVHEFNNLFTAILGWTQIARTRAGGDAVQEQALEIVEANVRRARELADHLLHSSSPRELDRRPIDLGRLCDEVLRLLAFELTSAGIQVQRAGPPVPSCLGDRGRLFQVLLNIVVNAIDAMPDGGTLTIALAARHDEVVLSISDSGDGMDEPTRARIFEPFFTTKRGAARPTRGGSGLGLAICREIVNQHGGSISVESAPGRGATFHLALPACADEAAPLAPLERERDSVPEGTAVLVVDDEPDIGEMLATALGLHGVVVTATQTGEQALRLAAAQRFQVALIDFSMPGLAGHQLRAALGEVAPDLPVIFMSGRELELDAGDEVSEFVKKPFDIGDVMTRLRRVLDGQVFTPR